MPADNASYLIAAARRRSRAARERTIDAIRHLDHSGVAINFPAVAARAGVSRSWLYRQADLRAEIERLRVDPRHSQPLLPAALRSSPDSLRAQRDALQAVIESLNEDNRQLAAQIERLLGERRAARPDRGSR
jgi:Family of unknown function (DUF6262)